MKKYRKYHQIRAVCYSYTDTQIFIIFFILGTLIVSPLPRKQTPPPTSTTVASALFFFSFFVKENTGQVIYRAGMYAVGKKMQFHFGWTFWLTKAVAEIKAV